MPKINWTRLSSASKQHLLDRLRERGITAADMFALTEWISHSPLVPDGEWFKDFGTFKLCGRGDTPLYVSHCRSGGIRRGNRVVTDRFPCHCPRVIA
jgi:hypothetical protein